MSSSSGAAKVELVKIKPKNSGSIFNKLFSPLNKSRSLREFILKDVSNDRVVKLLAELPQGFSPPDFSKVNDYYYSYKCEAPPSLTNIVVSTKGGGLSNVVLSTTEITWEVSVTKSLGWVMVSGASLHVFGTLGVVVPIAGLAVMHIASELERQLENSRMADEVTKVNDLFARGTSRETWSSETSSSETTSSFPRDTPSDITSPEI